jgi:hypothetical protein
MWLKNPDVPTGGAANDDRQQLVYLARYPFGSLPPRLPAREAALRDFVLRFPHGGRTGRRLDDGPALRLPGEVQTGSVTRIVRMGAMRSRFAAVMHHPVTEPGRRWPSLAQWGPTSVRRRSRSLTD